MARPETRVIAIDWSGRTGPDQKRVIWLAEASAGRLTRLENGRTRAELTDFLLEELARDGNLIVGLDFAFSLPAWYLERRHLTPRALWKALAEESLTPKMTQLGLAKWLRDPEPPFWRTSDAYRLLEPHQRFRRTDDDSRRLGSQPKSVFQLVGGGQVGPGSLFGMHALHQLAMGGYRIWPFDPPAIPMVVEIFPRILTGAVTKSSRDARESYVERLSVSPEHRDLIAASEDALDASVSALVMAEWVHELVALEPEPDYALEGKIWVPSAQFVRDDDAGRNRAVSRSTSRSDESPMADANPEYLRALAFAAERHGAAGQPRKGTTFPYVVHVIRVAEILDRFGYSEDVVVAGFLHDTVEDTDTTYDEIEAEFGERVAALVRKASEPDKSLDWETRKQHTIDRLRAENDSGALALVAADKLDNVLAVKDTLRSRGEKRTWVMFNAPREKQHWYYRTVVDVLLGREPTNLLFRTLDAETHDVFPDERAHTSFFAGKPLGNAHDVRAYLADPIKHWRPDYSAYELAHAWLGGSASPNPPPRIDAMLQLVFGEYSIVEGLFEKQTKLDRLPRASQTDLLLLLRTACGLAVVGVEAKAGEGFGKTVRDQHPNPDRLSLLCERLRLQPADAEGLPYQLLHRTVATILEAHRYGTDQALMLVHSFAHDAEAFDGYRAFASALGLSGAEVDSVTSSSVFDGVFLRLAWSED